MNDQRISLDIRTILAELDIEFTRFTEWDGLNEAGIWGSTDWLERTEDSEQQVAAAQS